ncbi:MAG TPA: glycosyltransferase family 4 protein [Casimicrobiaceae bacterium]|nr:glycosyltransferase family 4 protein [Casimicrobiaceae bacterium]
MPKRLLFEAWRGIHHSYALVAQQHCLAILPRADIELRFRDLPYFSPHWRRTSGVLDAVDEVRIGSIPAPEPEFAPEATVNMQAERPDFSPPPSGRKFVFGTPEFRVLREENVAGVRSARELSHDIHVLTPSRWTAAAYERFGFAPARIHVVPHGIDPKVIHPDAQSRAVARAAVGIRDEFVFMSIGAMTANKGIDLLLAAFAQVALALPHVRLMLKGADALYPSQEYLREMLNALPSGTRERVATRLLYQGSTFSARQMATFLRMADCYVAPYRAEGFNMPVLEGAGCGVPVICTQGGPTDEFTTSAFAHHIRSTLVSVPLDPVQSGEALAPDFDDLVQAMTHAATHREQMEVRGEIAAQHVLDHYTWDKVTDLLLGELFT